MENKIINSFIYYIENLDKLAELLFEHRAHFNITVTAQAKKAGISRCVMQQLLKGVTTHRPATIYKAVQMLKGDYDKEEENDRLIRSKKNRNKNKRSF